MNTADVDIDRLVDYRSEYTQYIKKAKITGDQLIGLCPFHDDKNNSLSVNLKTGQWHCFAEDRGGNFTQFYAEINGLDTKEAYKQIQFKDGTVEYRGPAIRYICASGTFTAAQILKLFERVSVLEKTNENLLGRLEALEKKV